MKLPAFSRASALLLTLALAGCPATLPEVLGDCPEGSEVGWADASQVFETHCTRCHSSELAAGDRQLAPVGVDYDSPEAAIENADLTWDYTQSGRMPNDDEPVSYDEGLILHDWLACGGPQ